MPKNVPIRYTSRDFATIKQDLVEYVKRYYPDTYKDFNEASFGSLLFDTVAYVGDILSFYIDYQANESFLDSAVEYDNVIRLARQLGYKFRGSLSSQGIATFYILAPTNTNGTGPDYDYLPILKKGSQFTTSDGASFLLAEDIYFGNLNNEVVVGRVDETTGAPSYYAVKARGTVISGELAETIITIGQHERFLRIPLHVENIAEITAVFDDAGHQYFEVDHLSQDVVYREISNRSSDRDEVKSILKPFPVPRRFVVEQEEATTFLQFGFGSESEITSESIADPSNVVLDMHGKDYVTNDSFDPSKLVATDKFGVAPANTKLTVQYRFNTVDNVNTGTNTLVEIVSSKFSFDNVSALRAADVNFIKSSLEVDNEERIVGDITLPTSEEVRVRALDYFATQNRAVTKQDYRSYIYSMPPKFGGIKRCSITQDPDSFKRNLNLHIVSEDQTGHLTATSDTIKKNLKTWLQRGKMVNDTIDILSAKIVNIGIEFSVIGDASINKYDILDNAVQLLVKNYTILPEIGEPFYITDIYKVLKEASGVLDVIDVNLVSKKGTPHNNSFISIDQNLSADGRLLMMPENTIWEVKFPFTDIKGTIK